MQEKSKGDFQSGLGPEKRQMGHAYNRQGIQLLI